CPRDKDQGQGIQRSDCFDQYASPRLPFSHGYFALREWITRSILTRQAVGVVCQTIMRLAENVVEHRRLVSITPRQQHPEIDRNPVGKRSNKVSAPTKNAIRVDPLQVQKRVRSIRGSPRNDPVQILKILLGTMVSPAIQRPVLVERDPNDVAVP